MSASRFVVIAVFESSAQAYTALAYLETEGIEAFVRDGASTDTLWYLNSATGGVKLQVREEDADRASKLLREPPSLPTAEAGSWYCGRCHETVDAGFEVCWSCGGSREEFEDKSRPVEHESPPAASEPLPGSSTGFTDTLPPPPAIDPSSTVNPYASPQSVTRDNAARTSVEIDTATKDHKEGDESLIVGSVRRAYRAAIIGLVFCPFALHIYSLALLIYVGFSSEKLDAKNSRRYYIALVIDLLVMGGLALLFRGRTY